ncbi:ABC transporter ATP-binding protein [Xylophilus sp.]|uniref:ABC transporter ATP-binding protein n=1 Tax=Xylophilus sp. TaxID=2653893 RepID=UPI0013B7A6E5|nr:ABC transporter ATP-binding protein [Xylophilus sp.]KAF1042758.1 MAG: Lipopolysaccharide export system ATP-binding protein LptB [Xylophilus sp.]
MTAEGTDDLLVAQGIRVAFGGFAALDGVDLRLRRGAITGIVGPNGAGKSTLFNVLGGQQAADAGSVAFDGTDIGGWAAHRRVRRGLTRTFQISRELGALTVLENLLLALDDQPGEGILAALLRPGAVRRAEEAGIERARALLERVNLWRLADARADSLSGGQKKLLELCRALMLRPQLVLLDEPAAGVNPVRVGEVGDFIRTLRAEGMSFGIVEHNMDLIAALCDSIYVLAQGRVLRQGSFADISADAQVAEAYLGAVA